MCIRDSVYIAMPPLYRFTNTRSKKFEYVWDEQRLDELKKGCDSFEISRYKGLGEMNADQLKETTMAPSTRQLVQVSIEDAALAERRINILMGDNAGVRKEWIDNNVDFTFDGD